MIGTTSSWVSALSPGGGPVHLRTSNRSAWLPRTRER